MVTIQCCGSEIIDTSYGSALSNYSGYTNPDRILKFGPKIIFTLNFYFQVTLKICRVTNFISLFFFFQGGKNNETVKVKSKNLLSYTVALDDLITPSLRSKSSTLWYITFYLGPDKNLCDYSTRFGSC